MKILYFSPHPNLYLNLPSGPGIHMREMIAGFEKLGHKVTPLIMGGVDLQQVSRAAQSKGSSIKQKIKKVIPPKLWQTVKDRRLLRFDQYAYETLKAAVSAYRPDVIYERSYYLMTAGVRVAKEMGIPFVSEMNAPYPEEKQRMEGASLLIHKAIERERFIIQNADHVVVVSSALKGYFETHVPGSGDKIIVTPNAIREDLHPPVQGEIDHIRNNLNLEDSLVVGFVGSIFPYHGVDKLIRAFHRFHQAHKTTRLLIVGDGETLSDLKKLAASLGLQDRIIFTGRVAHSEVLAHIGAMDICMVPDQGWYMSPVKLFEYGFMGKAIIAVDTQAMRDVMTHKRHGVLTKNTEDAMYEALTELTTHSEIRQKMALAFQSKVLIEHTWERMAEKIISQL